MIKYFDNIAAKLAGIRFIRAIRKGLLYTMPLILIGSMILMVLNLPVPAFQSFLDALMGSHWREVALAIYKGTFQVMSMTVLMGVTYAYAYEHEMVRSGDLNVISVLLTSFASFIAYSRETDTVMSFEHSSSTGMFGAIVIALLSTGLFLFFYRRRFFHLRLLAHDADAILMASMRVVVPAFLTVTVFGLANVAMTITGLDGLVSSLYANLSGLLVSGGRQLPVSFVFIFLIQILWFFGLHGTNLLDQVSRDLFVTATEANIAAAGAGTMPTEILTKEFFDNFVFMGGCGATLGLLIALLVVTRNGNFNRMARFSLFPGIFNINEMMVYGLPIIFNPYYLVPFVLSPVVLSAVTFAAMSSGLVPLTVARVQWTTPIFLSGYVATGGSVAAVVLQGVNLVLSVLIYIPFVRMYEKHRSATGLQVLGQLTREIDYIQNVQRTQVIDRSDEIGVSARSLAFEIQSCLAGTAKALHLEYQPKVNAKNQVIGAEALLRWNHPTYGYVSPLVILALADEAGLTNALGDWVMKTAAACLKDWQGQGLHGIHLSVNLSPSQLRTDDTLVATVTKCLETIAPLEPSYFELELTENAAIDQSVSTRRKLERIKALGVNIAIDDFGMGHSSILYLRDFYANVLKIDISLVKTIVTDTQSQEIVKSVLALCNQLDVQAVAEGAENLDQVNTLEALGCHYYQGFYFSRSLRSEDFVAYVQCHGVAETIHGKREGTENA